MEKRKGTGVVPLKFESVDAAQLFLNQSKCTIRDELNKKLLEQRNKCAIYRLMHNNDDPRELDFFLGKLVNCLARDEIFPPAPALVIQRKYEKADITQAQNVLTWILNSHNLVYKRGLIWLGLRISASFINIFCPPPSEQLRRRFLVDPDKLIMMIKGEDQPVRLYLSAFCNNNQSFSLEHCVVSCCNQWNMLMPWLEYERWSGVSTNAPSVGLIANSNKHRRQLLGADKGPSDNLQYIEHAQVQFLEQS